VPVLLQNRQRAVAVNCAWLGRTAEAVLAAARVESAELSLVLVSDRRMRTLNQCYRKKDRTTDVLAFPLAVPYGPPLCKGRLGGVESLGRLYRPSPLLTKEGVLRQPPVLLGDVVISVPTAKRQAAALGHSLRDEVARLLVHGVLHLLGYDHERSERDALLMARKEKAVLRAIRGKGN
jgi:rRNA maturation RNase YbeY